MIREYPQCNDPRVNQFRESRVSLRTHMKTHLSVYRDKVVGRDGVVGIATRYGIDGPGIKSRWRDFPHLSSPAVSPPSHLYNGHRVSSLGVKRPEPGNDQPPPSNAEVKERVELYLYSPLCLHSLFYGELYFYRKIVGHFDSMDVSVDHVHCATDCSVWNLVKNTAEDRIVRGSVGCWLLSG
jgi:hypothetical protein